MMLEEAGAFVSLRVFVCACVCVCVCVRVCLSVTESSRTLAVVPTCSRRLSCIYTRMRVYLPDSVQILYSVDSVHSGL